MSGNVPLPSRIRVPELTGKESWLDPHGDCKTTFADVERQWGVSEDVAFRIMLLRTMPYEEYLKSPHWQAVRREVWVLQDGKCGACATGVIRDIHHRGEGYDRKGFERDEDVIGLCRQCHEIEHNSLIIRLREEARNL
jgi:hypothetical protein